MWIFFLASVVALIVLVILYEKWIRWMHPLDLSYRTPRSMPKVLLEQVSLPCGAVLSNRIAKAAMTEHLATADGAVTPPLLQLYKTWAESGAGMLLTGNIMVDPRYKEGPFNVVVSRENTDTTIDPANRSNLAALQQWARGAQEEGVPLWAQISHSGRQCPRSVNASPVAPSPIAMVPAGSRFWSWLYVTGFATPREMTNAEIVDTIGRFAYTAKTCKQVGFHGVQIHSAHGYLCSQFLSPITNRRTDEWGGSAENRRRFLLEVVRAVRHAVGPAYPVAVKLNSADFQRGGFTEEESEDVVRCLVQEKIDLIEISGGSYENPVLMDGEGVPTDGGAATGSQGKASSTALREAYFLHYARRVRAIVPKSIPIMLTGGFRTVSAMEAAVQSGVIDVAGLARPFALEPKVAALMLSGEITRSPPVHVSVGLRVVDALLQNLWHQHQMRRLAHGKTVNLDVGFFSVVLVGFLQQYLLPPRSIMARWFARLRGDKSPLHLGE